MFVEFIFNLPRTVSKESVIETKFLIISDPDIGMPQAAAQRYFRQLIAGVVRSVSQTYIVISDFKTLIFVLWKMADW